MTSRSVRSSRLALSEYVRKNSDFHCSTIEGVFSLIKRVVLGMFSVGHKHLPNYLNEFEFG